MKLTETEQKYLYNYFNDNRTADSVENKTDENHEKQAAIATEELPFIIKLIIVNMGPTKISQMLNIPIELAKILKKINCETYSEVTYRRANPGDADELHKLNKLFNGKGISTAAKIRNSIRNSLHEIVVVAEYDDILVGFCCGLIHDSIFYSKKSGEITEMYVMEEHRRKGIGKELVNLLESEFAKKDIKKIHLLTGDKNENAQEFYRSCGYNFDGEIVMEK